MYSVPDMRKKTIYFNLFQIIWHIYLIETRRPPINYINLNWSENKGKLKNTVV